MITEILERENLLKNELRFQQDWTPLHYLALRNFLKKVYVVDLVDNFHRDTLLCPILLGFQ